MTLVSGSAFCRTPEISFLSTNSWWNSLRKISVVPSLALLIFGALSTYPAQARSSSSTTLSVTAAGSAVTTINSGTVVTFTASVTSGGAALTTGQVNLCDATATYCTDIHILGTAQLTSAGTANLKFRPGPGTHSYRAVFLGTNTYGSSTSADSSLRVTSTLTPIVSSTTVTKTGNWGNYELTGLVAEIGSAAPITGAVSFLDSSYSNAVLGTAPLGKSTLGITWLNPQTPLVGFGPEAIAVGDFNGDGILDLAETNIRDNTVKVLLGNGDGTFTVSSTLYTVTNPISIMAADFNGDGILDLAVASQTYSGTMTILLGKGDGTFTQVSASPAIGSEPSAVTVADLNGDGIPDMAVSSETTGVISILLGKGDGTFTASQMTLSNTGCVSDIASGDFNGDGKADLVVTGNCEYDQNNSVIILPGNGDGTFQTGTVSLTGLDVDSVVVADLNADGKADLVLANSDGSATLAVLLGNGDGTFTAANLGPPVSTHPASLTIGDFNGDGIPDVVYPTGLYVDSIIVLFGNGDGTFTQSSSVPSAGSESVAIAVGDFNGDGYQDMAVVNYFDSTLTVLLTQPTQTAATAPTLISPVIEGQHLVDASYPGSSSYNPSVSATTLLWGQPPTTTTMLAVTAGGSSVSTVASGTAVTLTATVMVGVSPLTNGQVNFCDASTTSCSGSHLVGTAQLTANGTAAFKFIPGPGQHSYRALLLENAYGLASASGIVGLTVSAPPHVLVATATTIAASGTINNYTLTSTVTGTGSTPPLTGTVSFLDTSYSSSVVATAALGSSSPSLAWPISSSFPANPAGTMMFATGDFNGDGIVDIAAVNSNAMTLTILLGNGDGTFKTTSSITLSAYTTAVIAGDFNRDGKLDLAVSMEGAAYNAPGSMAILLGNGDGTFTAATSAPVVGNFAKVFAAADFNGDGKLDLVVNDSTGTRILLGNGDGTFSQAPVTGLSTTLAVADLNGDGLPDLLVVGGTYAGVYLSNGDGTFRSAGSTLPAGTQPGSAVVADLNGDGIPDIALAGAYYSPVVVFLGKGDGTFTQVAGNSTPSINEPMAIATADFNQDGKLDLVITNMNSDSGNSQNPGLTILLGNGDGTFSQIIVDTQLYGTGSIIAADFNGDGRPDFVVSTGPGISVMLTEPTETASATATGVSMTGPAPHLVDASYPGDTNFAASVSTTTSLDVQVAMPVITPASGTYTSTQTLTITDATPGAAIYYQASGILQPSGWTLYTGPMTLATEGQANIQAYAKETGYEQSGTANASINLNLPPAPTPVISPASGSYPGVQTITITDAASGVPIYYTTNGSYPTTQSAVYTGPITVSASTTIVAIASGNGYYTSKMASAQYYVDSASSAFIYTIAGTQAFGYRGDGGLATVAMLNEPESTVMDATGNLYIADSGNSVVRKVDAKTGVITTFAGNGTPGYSGDSGLATSAQLNWPAGLAFDQGGNLFISENVTGVVRRVDATTGIITTFAGNATATAVGDGGPATSAQLINPFGLAFDTAGNLYIGSQARIRKVSASTGTITTVAGFGTVGYSGDNGPATIAMVGYPSEMTFDGAGNLYFADWFEYIIRKVNISSGVITTIAGTPGGSGFSGDGGPVTSAKLAGPYGVAVDAAGDVFIADTSNSAIREVTTDGKINTIAGVPTSCSSLSGDGGPANNSAVCAPYGVAVDAFGNLYISEAGAARVRKITPTALPPTNPTAAPTFSVLPGSYSSPQTVSITSATPCAEIYITLDGTTPTPLVSPSYHGALNLSGSVTVQAIAVAPGYLPSSPVTGAYTITSTPLSVISTVAGNGTYGSSGVNGPATSAQLGDLYGLAVDSTGVLYIPDASNSVVWKVSPQTGTITVAAGTLGSPGSGGNGGPATSAQLWWPTYAALDKAGNLYIADSSAGQVRVVSASGVINVYAGTGLYYGGLGDGGPATSATLSYPAGLAVDSAGNLYIADEQHGRIRMVAAATGIITTVAGGSTTGALGDGGPATSASLTLPGSIASDSKGNLFIADTYHGRVRRVDAQSHIITTVAGDGDFGSSGDGGLATSAEVYPLGIAANGRGDLYVSNSPNTVRKVDALSNVITLVAGTGYRGYSGDGSSATVADLTYPSGLATGPDGSLYIADSGVATVRKVTFSAVAASLSVTVAPASSTVDTNEALEVVITVSGAAGDPTPTGTVTLSNGNYTSAPATLSGGIATITIPAGSLGAGSDTLVAIYSPDSASSSVYNGGSGAASVTVTSPVLTAPSVTVTPSASSISTNQSLPVVITVSGGAGNPTPSGTVALTSGSYASSAATLSAGAATVMIPAGSLSTGGNTLTATYSPDNVSSSIYKTGAGTVAITVTNAVYTMSATALTLSPGGSGNSTVTVSTSNGYSGTVTLSCKVTATPAGATDIPTCTTAQTATLSSTTSSATATVTVSSTAASAALILPRVRHGRAWTGVEGGAILAFVLFALPRRRDYFKSLVALVALAILGGLVSCGGGGGSGTSSNPPANPGTTSGSYTITITGIGSDAAKTSVTTTFTLTVN